MLDQKTPTSWNLNIYVTNAPPRFRNINKPHFSLLHLFSHLPRPPHLFPSPCLIAKRTPIHCLISILTSTGPLAHTHTHTHLSSQTGTPISPSSNLIPPLNPPLTINRISHRCSIFGNHSAALPTNVYKPKPVKVKGFFFF